MKRVFLRLAIAALFFPMLVHAAQFKFASQTLTVPDGFTVELVAQSPLADRPIYGSFDEQGRFYAVDSSGSNDKPDKQLEQKPHRVVRLVDTDGDGRFDKSTVFADKMMFPEGCLWFDGSLYVAAPPSIWKLTDTNHDGVADLRQEWHQGKTLTGCANDLHGPFLGLDGWIYWCKGASAEQRYERPGRPEFVSRAAHIFRAPPDRSDIEPVLTGGMDNPVSVAFTAAGERILCGTFFITHEPGKRDGLIHAIYGGVYGKVNTSTDGHKRTGELMPIMTHMGPAAPASVICYESQGFGPEYQQNLFACYFNLHKVSRHVLEPNGATFSTRDSDFLTSDNPDFHPTDVIEDADGSLVVVDTGGWYKICCPTSQLSKPDLLGAIYRIRRMKAPKVDDPRGLKLAWEKMGARELAGLLGEERAAVRKRAMYELGKRGKEAVAPVAKVLKESDAVAARNDAVWTLTRIDAPAAREAIRAALKDSNMTVRQAAAHSAGLWRDAKAVQKLSAIVQEPKAQLQRAAAEALGRIGDKSAVPALLAAAGGDTDRVLEHSLTYALIEINDAKGTAAGLQAAGSRTKRSALIALDQMDAGGLQAETVAPWLGSSDPILRETASWVAGRHPEWGEALAGFLRERLKEASESNSGELENQLSRFAGATSVQTLMAALVREPQTPTATRQLILRSMAAAAPKSPPVSWAEAVGVCLGQGDPALLSTAVETARVLSQGKTNAPHYGEALQRIGRDEKFPEELRLEALAALPGGLRKVEDASVEFLCGNVDSTKPVMLRSAAASVLGRAKLQDEQLLRLAEAVKTAGPLEITALLGAFEKSTNAAVGLKLAAALKESKALASLRPDLVKTVFSKYPAASQQKGEEVLAMLNIDTAKQSARVDELLRAMHDGDVRRGQSVFNSPKAACASCHKMGYMGGTVGPDLTSIGQVRTERDLLESIVYPSASFVRSFEPLIVHTRGDEEYSGVVKKDAADEILLATGPNAETRIPRSDVVEMRPGTVSIMPAGLDEQLTRQELADLLAFLKATKWGPQ